LSGLVIRSEMIEVISHPVTKAIAAAALLLAIQPRRGFISHAPQLSRDGNYRPILKWRDA
jgi:hypothetical protein